jgi:membrane-bound lytic murein transglycosylase D
MIVDLTKTMIKKGMPFVLLFLAITVWPQSLLANVPVERHKLSCGADFPCPKALKRRTDFWIQVYRKWTTKQGVFHDSLNPERVYSVINVKNGCSKKSTRVKKEKKRIQTQLNRIASDLERGRQPKSSSDKKMMSLFPDKKAKSIRTASSNIRCQQGNRDRFTSALKRYGAYGGLVKKLVVDAGLPSDIHFLPFVESLYNPHAYSRVGAAGLWQIMPATARQLGLELNATVDERLDLESATLGAVRYLNDSRKRLTKLAKTKDSKVTAGQLTPFVITSYNFGVSGMRRALDQVGTDFVSVLNNYKSPSFQVAVKNFYASFLAARHVAKNSKRYFGKVVAQEPIRYHTVLLKHATSLDRITKIFGLGEKELKDLNRGLTRFVWHGWRMIPRGYRLRLPHRQGAWKSEVSQLTSLSPEDESRRPVRYTVRKGDTACGIARAFRVKCKDLIDLNRLGRRAFITVKQDLIIPGKGGTKQLSGKAPNIDSSGLYTVRKGDSPCGIAIRADIPCTRLLSLNGLSNRAVIHPGQKIKLPGGVGSTSTKKNAIEDPSVVMTPSSYTVKAHDTACEIAARYKVNCGLLLSINGLKKFSVLSVGQRLVMPGDGKTQPNLGQTADPENYIMAAYKVRAGDSPCQISRQHDMPCNEFQKVNNLRSHSVIYVGQTLQVKKPVSSEKTGQEIKLAEIEDDAAGDAITSPLDVNVDFRIITKTSNNKTSYLVNVESDETLGHFADWLAIGSSSSIWKLNGLQPKQSLITGQRLLLPETTSQQRDQFTQKREEYHRVLVEEFKENYRVVSIENYTTKSGDSPWKIANSFQLPLWVITRYNPSSRLRMPSVGEVLKIPYVVPKS